MKKTILVTGGTGLVGHAIQSLVQTLDHSEYKWIFLSSNCDLRVKSQVIQTFQLHKPTHLIHLAANVGGLYKNMRDPIRIFNDNILMNENILEVAHQFNVQKGIFILSSCIFPVENITYPMKESDLHIGIAHPSNESYAYAKRMLELQCRNYNRIHGRNYICLSPVNIYGPHDNYELKNSHVIPGIIHRLYLSIKKNKNDFVMYGSGRPVRQFIYSEDLAKIIFFVLEQEELPHQHFICCGPGEISIKELTFQICKVMGYKKKFIGQDCSKSDGCLKKTVDNSRLMAILPDDFQFTSMESGLKKTIEWFLTNYGNCRGSREPKVPLKPLLPPDTCGNAIPFSEATEHREPLVP